MYLLCGLPGSGKTTLAKQLEREHSAIRFSPDEWIQTIYGTDILEATLDAARDPVETVQWQTARRALELGINVVLDFGVWSRRERDDFRARAAEVRADTKLCYLDVPIEVLLDRIECRNAELPAGCFHVTAERMRQWDAVFERPEADEL